MDLASLLGFVLCFGMIIFGVATSAGLENIGRYIDVPSVIITFGGAFFAVMCMNSMQGYIGGLKTFTLIFKTPSLDVKSMIQKIIDLSNVARKEGLLSLEEAAGELDDAFMKKGILFMCCGTDDGLVYPEVKPFEDSLVAAGVKHEYREGPGNHEMYFWQTMLDPAFSFLAGIEEGTKDKLVAPF